MAIRVAIVEDDEELRKLTASIINFYPDMECVGAYESAESFGENILSLRPDVVLMDINLPDMDGIECVRKWKPQLRGTQFIMITSLGDPQKTFDSLRCGATGYIIKPPMPEQIAAAIREVWAGGSPMSASVARLLVESFQQKGLNEPKIENLTKTEYEILKELDQGFSYKEIAAHRFIDITTVQSHIRHIYEKLHVHCRTDALNKVFHSRS